jgi:CelD/BcsL family acetyltransferase involved in cellulose biosynthesis
LAYQRRDAGEWTIIAIERDGQAVGVVVLGIDQANAGRVLEVCGLACDANTIEGGAGRAVERLAIETARASGCRFVRWWSMRPLQKLPGVSAGWRHHASEFVLEVGDE